MEQREDCPGVIDHQMNNSNQGTTNLGSIFSSLLDKICEASRQLDKANKELKKKIILRKRLMVNCELMISQMVSNLSETCKVLEKSKQVEEDDKTAVANLRSRVVELESRLSKFRGLKLREDEIRVNKLRKEACNLARFKRMEIASSKYLSLLDVKNIEIKKWEHQNNVVMPLLNEFATRLAEAGLLTENFKRKVMRKYGKESLPSSIPGSSGASLSQSVDKNLQLKKLMFQNENIMGFLKEFGAQILRAGLLNPTFSLEVYARYKKDGFSDEPSTHIAQLHMEMGNEAEASVYTNQ